MKYSVKSLIVCVCLPALLSSCVSAKKDISMKIHSDPLGAYALMKVNYKNKPNSDWIFLGPTPINQNKRMNLNGADSISFKVMREGFFEQEKNWKIRDFLKEHKSKEVFIWVPNLVEQ